MKQVFLVFILFYIFFYFGESGSGAERFVRTLRIPVLMHIVLTWKLYIENAVPATTGKWIDLCLLQSQPTTNRNVCNNIHRITTNCNAPPHNTGPVACWLTPLCVVPHLASNRLRAARTTPSIVCAPISAISLATNRQSVGVDSGARAWRADTRVLDIAVVCRFATPNWTTSYFVYAIIGSAEVARRCCSRKNNQTVNRRNVLKCKNGLIWR